MSKWYHTPPEEVTSYSQLKKIADYWYRRYRLATADRDSRGRIFCPLKKKWLKEKDIQLCHYIDRACMYLRYDDDNCILCSKWSNEWDSKVPHEDARSLHHADFEALLGDNKVDELLEKADIIYIFDRDDYVTKINCFKDRINENKNL